MEKKDDFKTFYAVSFAWQLGFLIAIPIGVFILLGFFADRFFRTSPLFLMIGAVLGMTVTGYEIYHMLAPLLTKEPDSENKKDDKH